jgi:MFS family permease
MIPTRWLAYGVLAFFMVDFGLTFLTFLPYWLGLDGDMRAYGVVLGLYGGVTSLGAPILGWLGDKLGEKLIFCTSIVLSVAGNILFFASSISFGESPHASRAAGQALLILSRMLCGFAAGSVVLVLRYLIRTSVARGQDQVLVMNSFRLVSTLGRMIGPSIGAAVMWVGASKVGPFVVSGLTIPPLVSIGLGVVLLPFVAFYYGRDDDSGDDGYTQLDADYKQLDTDDGGDGRVRMRFWLDPSVRKLLPDVIKMNVAMLLWLSGLWLIFSQMVPIGMFEYSVVDSQGNLWIPFMPLAVGSLVAMLLLKRVQAHTGGISEFTLLMASSVGMMLATVPLFPFTSHPSKWFFYVGTGVFFLFNAVAQTSIRAIYSRVVGHSRYIGVLLSLLFVSGGIAQLVGSSIASAIVSPKIDSSWLRHHNCTATVMPNVTVVADCPCTVTPQQWASYDWDLDCYELENYAVLIGVTLAALVATAAFLYWALAKIKFRVEDVEANGDSDNDDAGDEPHHHRRHRSGERDLLAYNDASYASIQQVTVN